MSGRLITAAATVLVLATATLLATPLAWTALLPAMALLGGFVLFRRPELGFLGLVFLIPLETLRELGQSLSLAKLLGAAAIGVTGVLLLLRRLDSRRLVASVLGAAALFLGQALLSGWLSMDVAVSADNLRQLGITFAFFILGLLYLGAPGEIVRCLGVLVVSVTIPALFSVWQAATGQVAASRPAELMRESERAMGLMRDPNFFSVIFIVSLPVLAAWLLIERRPSRRLLALALMGLHAAALLLTYSRAAMLILVLEAALLSPLFLRRLRPRHAGPAFMGALVLVAALAAVTPQSMVDRALSLAGSSDSGVTDPSIARRKSYIPVALRHIAERPLFGSGPGMFPHLYARSDYAAGFAATKEDYYRMAHNTWLEVAAGLGLPGLALLLGLVGVTFLNLFRAGRAYAVQGDEPGAVLARCLQVSFLGLLLILTTISAPYHRYLWLFAALSHGLVTAARPQPVSRSAHDFSLPQREHRPVLRSDDRIPRRPIAGRPQDLPPAPGPQG